MSIDKTNNCGGGGSESSLAKDRRAAAATARAVGEAVDDEVAKVFEGDDGL